ncbi:Peptide chain release factor class I/class II [Parasponia andersonii]|uniref:Peptide chain release factor class I/class II n=1 Tax=Parasponia andersonii TaxID=3476 RepID=A0A2P5BY86_PARAD|nr:Peptide chain release factor class I/class II [Parasponia andersonii]
MALSKSTANAILNGVLQPSLALSLSKMVEGQVINYKALGRRMVASRTNYLYRGAAWESKYSEKVPSRFSEVQQRMLEAEERVLDAEDDGPTPQITLDHVTVSFARSGGPGGQNVNKVSTKVDMRFNVKYADWLSWRIRERIMQMEKNRINRDGELVVSSTKTRTQKDNIEDALGKLQAIIDAAAYVPPPPSEEQKKKLAKIAAAGEQKRLKSKKALSDKKAFRRSRDSWD